MGSFGRIMGRLTATTRSKSLPSVDRDFEATHGGHGRRVNYNLSLSPKAADLLDELARKTQTTREDVLRNSLVLFQRAVESVQDSGHTPLSTTP